MRASSSLHDSQQQLVRPTSGVLPPVAKAACSMPGSTGLNARATLSSCSAKPDSLCDALHAQSHISCRPYAEDVNGELVNTDAQWYVGP